MATVFDYIQWRGDLPFSQDPPNAVDALIFSGLAYVKFVAEEEPVTLQEAAMAFFALEDHETRSRVQKDQDLLLAAAESKRFGQAKVCMYRDILLPEKETQFAAMTFLLDDGSMALAFRGTDNTLVGWKEDLNMSFQQTIPAQRLAQSYVRDAALEYPRPMHLCGHSKGGNLAVFAAARSSPMIQERIVSVYNNDGPGFTEYLMGDPGYLAIVPKIRTFVPQSSVIGMLLGHEEPYTVIQSKSIGLLQHDLYTWDVLGKEFLTVEEVTEGSQFVDSTIKTWFAEMTDAERGQLADVLYALLSSGGVDSVQEMLHPRSIRNYIRTLSGDAGLRKLLSGEFLSLVDAARKTRAKFEDEKRLPEPDAEL